MNVPVSHRAPLEELWVVKAADVIPDSHPFAGSFSDSGDSCALRSHMKCHYCHRALWDGEPGKVLLVLLCYKDKMPAGAVPV